MPDHAANEPYYNLVLFFFRDAVDELFQTPPQVVELSFKMTFTFHFTIPIQC